EDGAVRIISPDVGGGFGYKGLLCREEVALGWLALQVDHPVRWLEDGRERLSANANCREHHYQITGYASRDGKLLAIDCIGHVDAGAYSSYPISSAPEAAQIANLLPGPYVFPAYRCRSAAVATNKCPIIPYRGVARSGVCLALGVAERASAWQSKWAWAASLANLDWSHMKSGCETWSVPSRCRSTTWSANISTAAIIPNACGVRWRQSVFQKCGHGRRLVSPTAGSSASASHFSWSRGHTDLRSSLLGEGRSFPVFVRPMCGSPPMAMSKSE